MERINTWKANRDAKAKAKGKAKAKPKAQSAAAAVVTAMAVFAGSASDASAGHVGTSFGRTSRLHVSGIDVVEIELPPECEMATYFQRQHSGGRDNPHCWGDVNFALADALRRGKDTARAVGYSVEFDWPVIWENAYVHLFDPDPRGISWIAVGESLNPTSIPRKEALELFRPSKRVAGRPAFHLGAYPESLKEAVRLATERAQKTCVHDRTVYQMKKRNNVGQTTSGTGGCLSTAGTKKDKGDGAGGCTSPAGTTSLPGVKHVRGMSITINNVVKSIRSYLSTVATKVHSAAARKRRKIAAKEWLWDTGAAIDIVPRPALKGAEHLIQASSSALQLSTAGGPCEVAEEIVLETGMLEEKRSNRLCWMLRPQRCRQDGDVWNWGMNFTGNRTSLLL